MLGPESSLYPSDMSSQYLSPGAQVLPLDGPIGRDWKTAVRPVSIRQMHDAVLPFTGADFIIGGSEVKYVTAVAHVVQENIKVNGEVQRVEYTLEDGTSKGRIQAYWHRATLTTLPMGYARVSGTLFQKSSRNRLKINHMRAVTDPHEVYFHFLEVIAVTIMYSGNSLSTPQGTLMGPSRGPTPSPSVGYARPTPHTSPPPATYNSLLGSRDDILGRESSQEPPDSDPGSETLSEASFKTAEDDDVSSEAPANSLLVSPAGVGTTNRKRQGQDPYSHLTYLQREIILEFYDEDNNEQTLHVKKIHGVLVSRGVDVTAHSLAEALDGLCNEGYIHPAGGDLAYYQIVNIPQRAGNA